MKRLIALLLIAAIALLCACRAQEKAAPSPLTVNGTPLDAELFTYFLDEAVKALPDGSQEERINHAVQQSIYYVAVNSTFQSAGLTLSGAEKKEAGDETHVQWNLYGGYYEAIGVSRQAFAKIQLNGLYLEKLRQAYFGEGGPNEVSQDQLRAYLETRYVSFRAIRIPKKVLDADGNEVDRTAAQETALNEKLTAGLAAVNVNGTGIESVYATFVSDRNGDREEYAEVVTDGTDHAYPTEFVQAVRAIDVNTAAILDFNDSLYLVLHEDILQDEDIFEAYKDECLEGITEQDLRTKVDQIGMAYTSVKNQPAIAECWNSYWNALAKNAQSAD